MLCFEVYHSMRSSDITGINGNVGGCHNKKVLSEKSGIQLLETYVKADEVL